MKYTFTPSITATMLPSSREMFYWKVAQAIVWLIGIVMLAFLLFLPPVGVTLFWNILIPVAPALLVVGTGLWRNVCPLGTTALIPDRFGFSNGITLTYQQRTTLNFIALIALFGLIPLRHAILNTDGQATAFLIIILAILAVLSGVFFERKSGWCSGLCPVHQVEKFYGTGVAFTAANVHCGTCVKCSRPCPDSTTNISAKGRQTSILSRLNEYLLVGAFPGFVWGWFQVPDFTGAAGWANISTIYFYPILGAIVTVFSYSILKLVVKKENENLIINVFAASAVSFYYWFRLPQLFGFSNLDTNGTLIDLSSIFPFWIPIALTVITTVFFFWWMVFRNKPVRSWSKRPAYA